MDKTIYIIILSLIVIVFTINTFIPINEEIHINGYKQITKIIVPDTIQEYYLNEIGGTIPDTIYLSVYLLPPIKTKNNRSMYQIGYINGRTLPDTIYINIHETTINAYGGYKKYNNKLKKTIIHELTHISQRHTCSTHKEFRNKYLSKDYDISKTNTIKQLTKYNSVRGEREARNMEKKSKHLYTWAKKQIENLCIYK